MKRDYYEILGVSKTADDKKLKSAYRKLAKKYHPDANPGDKAAEQKFKEVGEAYAILSDPEKRKLYDAYGFAAFEGSTSDTSQYANGKQSGYQYTSNNNGFQSFHFDAKDAEDLFESMFGDIFGHKGKQRTSKTTYGFSGMSDMPFGNNFSDTGIFGHQQEDIDLHTSLSISFRDAALGCKKTIRLQNADGTGIQTLNISIPSGIDEGQFVRLKGKGRISSSGSTGDLLIQIQIMPDNQYTRKGLDVYTYAYIPFTTAVFGGEVMLPTLHGDVRCAIPKGMECGKKMRLKGKGISKTRSKSVGDEYVEIRIEVPKNLTTEEVKALERYAKLREKKQ